MRLKRIVLQAACICGLAIGALDVISARTTNDPVPASNDAMSGSLPEIGTRLFIDNPNVGCGDRYWSVFGGWNLMPSIEWKIDNIFDQEIVLSDGAVIGLNMGRQTNSCYRGEVEAVLRRNSIEDYFPSVGQDFTGKANNFAVMTNVYRDFSQCRLRPYVGGGIGASYLGLNAMDNDTVAFANDTTFAYQGMAGVKFDVNCRCSLYTEYRYFATTEFDMDTFEPDTDPAIYRAHNVIFGLQFKR